MFCTFFFCSGILGRVINNLTTKMRKTLFADLSHLILDIKFWLAKFKWMYLFLSG